MSYINTARKSRLTINGVDESARMISWAANDASAYKNGIINTSGTIVLGTTSLTQYDYQREAYKRGQTVAMELWNGDTSSWELHPRGLLYVLSTSFSAEDQTVSIDIGCQLSIWTLADNIDALYNYSPTELIDGQKTIQNISQALYSSNKLIYQDNTGAIVEQPILDLSSVTSPSTVPATWFTGSKTQAISAAPLSGDELPDVIDLNYSFVASEIFSEDEKVSTDTSNYDVNFEAVTWVREGTGDELSSSAAIDGSYSGLPGAAEGVYVEVVDAVKVNTSRTETTTETFGGPGGQILRSIQEVFAPGTEINAAYFKEKYSACRYLAALDGDADSTSCSYLQATSPILSERRIRTYTYDDNGTVTSEQVEVWKPVLAAAQPFNWKSGNDTEGQPLNFQEISLTDLYRDSVVITDYSVDDDGNNVETITSYRSGAVEYSAGIYASTGTIGTDQQTASEPTAYPLVQDVTSLALPTDTVTGSGTGMTVNVAWPSKPNAVTELTVTSSLSDCQYAVKASGGQSLPVKGIIQQGVSASRNPQESQIGASRNSAILYWKNLPRLGLNNTTAWTGGSGTGLEAYIPDSALPTLTSNVGEVGSAYRVQGSIDTARDWEVYTTSTSFVGATTDVLTIVNGGDGYEVGDTLTWTNSLSAAEQMGSAFGSFSRELAGSFGQSATTTTITAEVTAINPLPPFVTIANPGSNYVAGDQVRVTAAELTTALGETITQDLVFTIDTTAGGTTDLGDGIASLSQTNLDVSGSITPPPDSEYAASGGTVLIQYEYNSTAGPVSSITNEAGSAGSVFNYPTYAPEGQGVLDPVSIEQNCVRGSGGLQIIDNGYIRSAAIPGNSFYANEDTVGQDQMWTWESWVYIDATGDARGSLFNIGSSQYPVTYDNIPVGNSNRSIILGDTKDAELPLLSFDSTNLYMGYSGRANEDVGYKSLWVGASAVAYPQKEWFHVALSSVKSSDATTSRFPAQARLFVNGVYQGFAGYTNTNPDTDVYIYTGAGGFSNDVADWGPDGFVRTNAPLTPDSNNDYVKIALDLTRFTTHGTGSSLYYLDFTPIDKDPTPSAGLSLFAGTYEGLDINTVTGIGKAATGNLEIIPTGSGGAVATGPGWDVCLVSPAVPYTESIGEVSPSGGSGSGMKVELGIGYSGETYTGSSPIVIRTVTDNGTGYANGDELTISDTAIEALLASYGGGLVDNGMRFTVTTSFIVDGSVGGGAWLFPDVVGTQYAVGDTVEVSRFSVIAANAGDPEQDIQATVTAITPTRDLRNLTLDALDGGKRIVVNTSKTESSLPDAPDTNATPQLPALEDTLKLAVRLDSYLTGVGTKADPTEEELQVPVEYRKSIEIKKFANDYARYLSSFITGEGYGLRIGEAMRPEIMSYWSPMVGLRYEDERIGEVFAMRADAASWGVNTEEAAVVYNGIWLGEISFLAVTDETIDGGNFTTDVTLALDNDSYDGGDVTAGTSIAVNDDAISGGNFTTGNSGVEDYLDVGKVLAYRMELSFDSAQTFVLGSSGSDVPFSVDWEGDTLTENIATNNPTHDYEEGTYSLGVYYDSGDSTNLVDLNYFSYPTEALAIQGVHFTSNAAAKTSIASFLRGAANLTSFTVSNDADFGLVNNLNTAFRDCSSLTSFPYFLTSTSGTFNNCWRNCTSLKDFPPNFFDHIATTVGASPFANTWNNCALSSESIQNILVSLDTMTLLPTDSPITNTNIGINGGTNAAYSTWSTTAQAALTSLQAKGWNVLYNT